MSKSRPLSTFAARALGVLAACGPSLGDDHGDATLRLDPPASEHLILNGAAARQTFTATLVERDVTERDVTAETTFSIDASLGAFAGNELTLGAGSKTTAYGVWKDRMGTAQVIARVKATRVEPPLDPGVPDLFTLPEEAVRAPAIVYPPIGVVVPRNLGDFETHWIDPSGNDVFEVSLRTSCADAGQDPTAPAFRLPFQNLTGNNHIAQWTERVVTQ